MLYCLKVHEDIKEHSNPTENDSLTATIQTEMNDQPITDTLFRFIGDSPTPFHAVANIVRILKKSGFTVLDEGRKWQIEKGGRYAVVRNGALIAFTLENLDFSQEGFRVLGGHTDSPSLQLKPHPRAMSSPYFQFGVEK